MPARAALPRRPALLLAIAFILLTAAYSLAWIYGVRWRPTARMGADFALTAVPPRIETVEPGGPADRAGLRPGDRILAVDGQPIARSGDVADTITARTPGVRVVVTVERTGTGTVNVPVQLEAARPPERPEAPWPVGYLLQLYPVGFLLVAAFVLVQRPQDPHAWLLAVMFASFIAAAPITEEPLRPPLRQLVIGWRTIFYALGPAIFYVFFGSFPARSPIERQAPWLKWVLLGAGAVVAAVLWTGIAADPRTRGNLQVLTMPAGQPLLTTYAIAAYVAGGLSLLWNNFRNPSVADRRRTRVIVWGTAVGFGPVFTLQLIAGGRSIYETYPHWLWMSAVLLLYLLPLSFAYAVVRHRVLEVPLLLKRSARYFLVQRGFVVLLMAIGGALAIVLASGLARLLPGDVELAVFSGLLAGVGLVWGGTRVERHITERLDRAFFRSAYDARHLLEELAGEAARTTDRQELAALLRTSLDGALQPTHLHIYLACSDRLEFATGTTTPDVVSVDPALPDFVELARAGEPVIPAPDESTDDPSALHALGAECLAPLTGRAGELLGLICLGPRRSEEPYSGEDRALLAAVSRQAGLALENITLAERIAARLEAEQRLQREMEIARQVQRKLFPQRFPALATVSYAGACLQARAVGGDYYDFLDFGPGSVGFVLADISGKGIHAALLMASLQANLRSQYALARHDVGALLESVDRLFFESTASNHFATMFFGRYEDASRRLVYANCGHNPPLLARAGGEVRWLEPTTSVLGLFDVWRCQVAEVEIGPGDTLVLYTDGVTEALSDAGEEFGESRLVETVQRHRDLEPAPLLTAILAAVQQFSGSEQEDDVTMVAIRGR